jgi:RNA polymerase sigma-70 factor (ECF subfamily)
MSRTSLIPRADGELIARISAGDARACEQFVREHGGQMLAVARRFLHNNEHDAADAVQDAFITAFASIDRFESRSAVATWLHRIVANACLMKLRRGVREGSIQPMLPTFDSTGHHMIKPRQWEEDAPAALQRQELRHQVRACIDRLPEPYRSVLLLRDIEEFDTEQTARMLGCTANNVKVRLHRARQALKTLLDPLITE